MTAPWQHFEWQIGWRYTRGGRRHAATGSAAGRNGFISFISAISVLGIALGVAALIIILSVMNGFQKEVRDRMLSVIPHAEISDAQGNALTDWRSTAAAARAADARVQAAAPFIAVQALLGRGQGLRGALVRGIDPAEEARILPAGSPLEPALLGTLQAGTWNIVLGGELARQLDLRPGDKLTLVAPGGQVTPAGVLPRLKQFTVSGVFDSGHFELDASLAMIHLDDAARLFRLEGPSGVQLKLADQLQAREVSAQLAAALPAGLLVRDWTRVNANWYDAVQVEKRLMGIILMLIVAVAAFNLVSTLVMTVTDKRADIAILRTLGASPHSIMGIFVVQGALAGVIGTFAGLLTGVGVALNIDVIVPAIERALGIAFLPGSIYLISRMPSQPLASDIVPIGLLSLLLAFLATLYPSWRASRIHPAQALRHE
ncbi:MAG: lipoprotein-releasing ABC transporter permease subunit [Rubrivivax sp.]|nr:lipoprotein-releasing ABC transporter permease subunit [Rubrivivax sp.]